MTHDKYTRLIDELIVRDVEPGEWSELHRHLAGCVSCRARYDRVALAERMLHGGSSAVDTPSSSTLKRLEGAVLGAAAPAPMWQRAVQWFAPTQRWAVAVAAAAALVVLLPFLARAPKPHDEFQARGTTRAATERTAGLRAFCIGDDGVT
ncbi:MAG: hypothetical protein LC659_09475, partial [Myxococcales bacterium]|nr:hypothetical protein [Myxococcales bacterium]